MKREKITYPIVKSIKPFFWKECRFCHKEFKREQGFEIIDECAVQRSFKYKETFVSYACSDCCKSIQDVKNKINKGKGWRPKPPISAFSGESNIGSRDNSRLDILLNSKK